MPNWATAQHTPFWGATGTLGGLKYGRGWLITTPFVERTVKEPPYVLRNGHEKALHRPLGDTDWVQKIVGHPAQADPGVITKTAIEKRAIKC